MKVHELVDICEGYDPYAEVVVVSYDRLYGIETQYEADIVLDAHKLILTTGENPA